MSIDISASKNKINFLDIDTETEFYSIKKEIEKQGYHIPSLEELAGARLESQDMESPLLEKTDNKYTWTRDFSIYVPGEKGIYLGKRIVSPIIANDKAKFHRRGHMYPYEKNYDEKSICLTENELEKYLSDCIFIKQTDLDSNVIRIAVPTDSFGKDIITSYLFGKETGQAYGEFLKKTTEDNAKFIHLELEEDDKIHSRQLCLGNIMSTNNVITNKCRLYLGRTVSPDARMIGLKRI